MIIVGEKREGLNIIHLIYGSETEFQLDMTGQCIVDISEYIKEHQENTLIVMNRCRSEEEVAKILTKNNPNNQIKHQNNEQKNSLNDPSEESNQLYKCPVCLEENKSIMKDGVIQPCKSCQLIDHNIGEFNTIDKSKKQELLQNKLLKLIKNNPDEFKSFLHKTYYKQKRNEK